jgi:hypothetical protein
MTRLAIVVPRYGREVLGGAENLAREFARHLPRDEFEVTVLTTCARELVTWQNIYRPGEQWENGQRILRFTIERPPQDGRIFRKLNDRFNRGEPAHLASQVAWLEHQAHSPALYLHLACHRRQNGGGLSRGGASVFGRSRG